MFTGCNANLSNVFSDKLAEYIITWDDLEGEWVDTVSGNYLTITHDEIIYIEPNKKNSSYLSGWNFDGKYIESKFEQSLPFNKLEVTKNGEVISICNEKFNFIKIDDYQNTIEILSVGETAKTDKAEFTLKDVEFAELVNTYTYLPTTGNSGLSAGEGQIYVCVFFDIINFDKSKLDGSEIEIIIDYNEGYQYTSKEITNDFVLNGNTSNYSMPDLDPLVKYSGHGIIKCAEIVGKDKEAPLEIIVVLPTENGIEHFIYKIR